MVLGTITSPAAPTPATTASSARGLSIGTRVPKPPLCAIGLRVMSQAAGNHQARLRLATGSTHATAVVMGIVVTHVVGARAEGKESKKADGNGGGKSQPRSRCAQKGE
jgi:hypothetical protein